jgi:hypothetical protein
LTKAYHRLSSKSIEVKKQKGHHFFSIFSLEIKTPRVTTPQELDTQIIQALDKLAVELKRWTFLYALI